jgi:energy-coupling factor transport system ATP-binding protein
MSLRLRGVRYTYAGTGQPALDGIDLDVAAGQVVGLVGPNEAGKSTLCLVAAGLAPGLVGGRLEGSVQLDGRETVGLLPHEAAQRRGIVFQNPLTQLTGTEATVFEEVAFGPRNLGLDLDAVVERVESALRVLGITHLGPCHPLRLSGGQAQLVVLASILALRPRVLVLDEPTSQLDPDGTCLVGDALARLAAETGTAILVAEHRTELLARLAQRVAVLDGGRMVRHGPAREVLGAPELEARGVGRPASIDTSRASVAGAPRDAIVCEAVSFTYPDGTRALERVDLRVRTGERLALIGQNGSGKSTLVRHFNGLLRPTTGTVTVLGEPLGARRVAGLARQVGLMFQHPDRQLFAGTVREEVAFGARNVGLRGRALDEAVALALDAAGLTGTEALNPYDLGASGRKLLALASILSMGTPLVVLDEPTAGLDARGVARVHAIIHALSAAGRTVIAISHDPRFVAEAFERVVVMRAGAIVLDGAPGEVFSATGAPLPAPASGGGP